MTEHTPEKVADLIAEARTALAEDRIAHWVVEGGMESVLDALEAVSAERDTLLGPDSDDRDELITAPILRALRIAKAERDAAVRDLDARFAESDHLSAKYYQRMRDAEALAQKANLSIIGLVRMANERADERDEALAAITEVLTNPNGFEWDVPPTAKAILSRIPEHPKED